MKKMFWAESFSGLFFQLDFYFVKKVFSNRASRTEKNQFLIFDHSKFLVIDDKHIVINNESPFRLLYQTSPSNFSFPPLSGYGASRLKNFIKLKWKSICSASEMSTDLFLLNVNIFCSAQSSLMNHYCRSRLFLPTDMQLCKCVTRHSLPLVIS